MSAISGSFLIIRVLKFEGVGLNLGWSKIFSSNDCFHCLFLVLYSTGFDFVLSTALTPFSGRLLSKTRLTSSVEIVTLW